jgi:hypothetical protein
MLERDIIRPIGPSAQPDRQRFPKPLQPILSSIFQFHFIPKISRF